LDVKALDRISRRFLALTVGALVLQLAPVHAGQKIRFSDPASKESAPVGDLKASRSLAPENLAGFKRGGDVNTDVLPAQSNEPNNPSLEKKRQQMLEERNNWLDTSASKRNSNPNSNPAEEREESKKDPAARDENDARNIERQRSDSLRKAIGMNQLLNGAQGKSATTVAGTPETDKEKKDLESPQDGRIPDRSLRNLTGSGSAPGDLRPGGMAPRVGPSFENREAIRKQDADHLQSLLNPTPIRGPGLGDNPFGSGPARGPATIGVPGGISSGSSFGGPSAAGQRSLGGNQTLGPNQVGPLGIGPAFNNGPMQRDEPLRTPPKPARLEIPKRNQ
jgi:hypothetical protein